MLKQLLVFATAALVVGCSSPPPADPGMVLPPPVDTGNNKFTGIYRQQGSDLDGSLYRLEAVGDGRFAMANLSSVFYGTWAEKDGQITLTIIEGSSGKLSKPVEVRVVFEGGDMASMGEEWGRAPFVRQRGAEYLISFEDTTLEKK